MNDEQVANSRHLSREVETEQRTFPEPTIHQLAGMVVINDFEHTDTLYDAVEARYQDSGRQPPEQVIVTEDYQLPDRAVDTEYVVTVTASEWKAGVETGASYEPAIEYAITLRQGDPQTGDLRNPPISLSLKVTPQQPVLEYPDGRSLSCPYGHGTRLTIQTSFVNQPSDLITRASDLLDCVFGCPIAENKIHPESTRFWHAELYHRIAVDRLGELAQTLRRTQELIPMEGGPVETGGRHDGDTWAEVYLTSQRWDLLGFPSTDYPIQLKLYRAKHPQSAPSPMNHPKLEARLKKESESDLYHFDDWPAVKAALAAPLLSHLVWAQVDTDDLIQDRVATKQEHDQMTWQHPLNRRDQLRRHYEDLETELYRAATRNTSLRDILEVLVCERQAGCKVTYERLASKTGLSIRSIRKYVSELVDAGICIKRRARKVSVRFVAKTVRNKMESALNQLQDGETVGDRVNRADDRESDDS